MKKITLIVVIIITLLLPCIHLNAQVSTGFNFGVATNYVGWNALQLFPLNISHKGNQPINFFTGTTGTQRMTIRGQVGLTQGFVGIGQNFANPLSLLSVNGNSTVTPTGEVFRTTGPAANLNTWRMLTGPGNGTEKGMIFNDGNAPWFFDRGNFSLQATVSDMTFFTQPISFSTVGTERVRIVGVDRTLYPPVPLITTYPVSAGNVGIGTHNPLSMLQIGIDATNLGGYRDWMNVGTLDVQGSDNMYVGFKKSILSASDAIINWGNNPTGGGPDRLLFVFTARTAGGFQASTKDGLEAGRMITNGNRFFVGFGGDPVRRSLI